MRRTPLVSQPSIERFAGDLAIHAGMGKEGTRSEQDGMQRETPEARDTGRYLSHLITKEDDLSSRVFLRKCVPALREGASRKNDLKCECFARFVPVTFPGVLSVIAA